MQTAKNVREYRRQLREALGEEFLRRAMESFAVSYRAGRAGFFAGLDLPELVAELAEARDAAVSRLDELLAEFRARAEACGVAVHLAKTAAEANGIIAGIAREGRARRIVKAKSMTAEETRLNDHLEAQGFEVCETDLGEWIIQLRREGPSHMVLPAIHLSRHQVADLFGEVTGQRQEADIGRLVAVARRELRRKYAEADMGVSGANFAVAETGSLGLVTNEGNARLVTTLPRIHVALVGLDKLVPTLHDALRILKVLPRNATGQAITSYVTWITGPAECRAAPDGRKRMHVVFLDNGRRALARDPVFGQVLRCVRCGACANVCPVYRLVGGHRYGHVYIGAIGLVLTYFFHGADKAKNLVQNCINCGACKANCVAGIDLPRLIKAVHARIQDESGHPLHSSLLGALLKNRRLFHGLLRSARLFQKPLAGEGGYLRHLPMLFKDQGFRALPALAERPFRDLWPDVRPKVAAPKTRVALFAGCAQDFVYPEQLAAAARVLAACGAEVEFPPDQTCCGLPVLMLGETRAARDVALQNLAALASSGCDWIVCTCASCASHMKHGYAKLLEGAGLDAARALAARVVDFSSLVRDVLKAGPSLFAGERRRVTYHAPCHLCRGLAVSAAPRELIALAGLEYAPAEEEELCCGFGGTYSLKFPELSAEILGKKLTAVQKTGAEELVTDCPGCVLQLKGGMVRRGAAVRVRHIAELLAERLAGG
jgi:iron-sulfur cluster protein